MIHPTAEVSEGVTIGADSRVWEFVRIREGAVLGEGCIVGRGAYIDAGVRIGDRVKIQNNALVYSGTIVDSEVFIGPGAILTNDRVPRSATLDGRLRGPGDWTHDGIRLGQGCSIGAGSIIVAGCDVGRFALVGAGAVVTRTVPAHALVMGNPARLRGWVCRCGQRLVDGRGAEVDASHAGPVSCTHDGLRFSIKNGGCVQEPGS